MKNCICCGREVELREGACFNCAEAELIISEGVTMYDKGLDSGDVLATTSLQKVKLLVQSGWIYAGVK